RGCYNLDGTGNGVSAYGDSGVGGDRKDVSTVEPVYWVGPRGGRGRSYSRGDGCPQGGGRNPEPRRDARRAGRVRSRGAARASRIGGRRHTRCRRLPRPAAIVDRAAASAADRDARQFFRATRGDVRSRIGTAPRLENRRGTRRSPYS